MPNTTIAGWGLKLLPGKPHKFDAFPEEAEENELVLRITNAALGEKLADANERTVVKITKRKSFFDDDDEDDEDISDEPVLEEHVLTILTAGKVEQTVLNVEFGPDLVQFEVVGKNEVHLLGNWIDQSADNGPSPFNSDDDSDGEDSHFLEDVSSDVEINPEDLDSLDEDDADRFEEVEETVTTKVLKRGADAMDEDTPATKDGELSKKQKKKLAKKLKNDAGEAISVASETASPESKKTTATAEKPKSDKKEKEKGAAGEKQTLPGGLVIRDVKKGTGKAAKSGNTLKMRYIGKLDNGKQFDANQSGKPFAFRLGVGEVIKGWDQGLVGMQVGGERMLTIPSALGYGKKGAKPDIPANATLNFEVKLIDIK